jgi:hypothetical protein
MTIKRNRWTTLESSILKNNYTYLSKTELLILLPDRSWDSIKQKAQKLNLKRSSFVRCNGDASVLLEESTESYYWIGFLTADGCFLNNRRINLTLSIKDKDHLIAFSVFVGSRSILYCEKTKSVCTSIQDIRSVPRICQKFDLKPNKTEKPISFIPSKQELFLSWLVGFIDGDGHIRKQYNRDDSIIIIKLHSSWISVLNKIHTKLEKIYNIKMTPPKINNSGYSYLAIANSIAVNGLKNFALGSNINFLKRKWGVINESFQSRLPASQKLKNDIVTLYNSGYKQKQICKELSVSPGYVSKVVNQ